LRNSVALCSILHKNLRIFSIRANRPRGGGLRPQHLSGIEICSRLANAKTQGFEVGSSEVD
jgi:RNA 3'-terminal phosphate cyclase (ATP)